MSEDLKPEVILKIAKSFERAQYAFSNIKRNKIELAGLEPTLWKCENQNIFDLIKLLKKEGFTVNITTNGSLLEDHVDDFKKSEVDLLRVSLHSMNPKIYREITKSGNLEKVKAGIIKAHNNGISIKVNRLLIKGYLDDLLDEIEFCRSLGIPLKLYSLIPQCEHDNNMINFFISEYKIMEDVLKGKYELDVSGKDLKRTRMNISGPQIGNVEFKIFSIDQINHPYCIHCDMKNTCREYFAEYLRFNLDHKLQYCLCQKVFSTDLSNKISLDDESLVSFLKGELERIFIQSTKNKTFPYLSLRFIITEKCNYKCGFPNNGELWCHREGVIKIL